MSFFLKPLLITVFIRHVALAERITTALLISVEMISMLLFPVTTIVLFFLAFLHSYICILSVFSLLNRLVLLLCSTNTA